MFSISNALIDYKIVSDESKNPILYQFKELINSIILNSNADEYSYKQIFPVQIFFSKKIRYISYGKVSIMVGVAEYHPSNR